ncbi:hypothetical protein CCMA1212_009692 [Trichoderma ghanense]|uniref:Uncharacterized protein n=1 Tax=Trichoderma ghanense TaxID=65468 RepID=A0ABY2GR78_9HYPO
MRFQRRRGWRAAREIVSPRRLAYLMEKIGHGTGLTHACTSTSGCTNGSGAYERTHHQAGTDTHTSGRCRSLQTCSSQAAARDWAPRTRPGKGSCCRNSRLGLKLFLPSNNNNMSS